ncbi:MAG: RdgB/HAM1 family non-canonical purine NTP pyrophosphatase [Clostridiales bacterium]|nr:RdgB/HAM1 family non-canonical purine NTP pyrophosphatase [Clostridiales bacterium]
MDIILASNNKHKIKEFNSILKDVFPEQEIRLLCPADVGVTEEIEETGTTFAENALIKANACAKKNYISIADDSGLAVDALGGKPGIYSARYAGTHGDDEANNAKLLDELKNVPFEKRTAYYVCAIACVLPDGESFTVEGRANGHIADGLYGEGGFGYDPLFIANGSPLTWAQIPEEEKNRISHRAKAACLLAEKLKEWWETRSDNEAKSLS